ncbi:MAG: stage 0 sporulation family protein [Eubacterium sp.]|nr:stage 0 sporulation family protein [Eubacterium sp.]
MIKVIGIRFRNSGKVYYFDPQDLPLRNGGKVIVETARGLECGSVVLSPRDVSEEHVVQPLRPILRLATEQDLEQEKENRRKEEEAHRVCQQKISEHNLEMKLIKSEYTFDRKKLLFYFTAEGRVDFRDLVKDLAAVFKTRIELRQIGVRDETKILGGIGICGRPLCCSTYLSDFSSVSIKMAKEQNLSLNPTKISGACGRLMCCLKNEQETYEYLNKNLPGIGDIVEISAEEGEEARTGEVQTVNVLRQNARVLVEVGDDKEIIEVPAERMEVIMTRRKKNKERAKERERLSKEKKEKEKLKAQGEPEAEIQEAIEPEEKAERRQKKEHAGKRDRAEKPKRAEIRVEADSQGAAEPTERTDVKPEEDGQEKGGKTHRREGRRSRRSRRDGNRRQAENKPSENPPAQ